MLLLLFLLYTGWAVIYSDMVDQRGLSALVQQYLGKQLSKGEQMSDWERRPLRPTQKTYAGLCFSYTLFFNNPSFPLSLCIICTQWLFFMQYFFLTLEAFKDSQILTFIVYFSSLRCLCLARDLQAAENQSSALWTECEHWTTYEIHRTNK